MGLLLLFKLKGANFRFVLNTRIYKNIFFPYNYSAIVINFFLSLSGFSDHSPEEIRLEYYSSRASGDLQSYVSALLLIYV